METVSDSGRVRTRTDRDLQAKQATTQLRILTLQRLNGRTLAAPRTRQLVGEIEEDLGGDLAASQRQRPHRFEFAACKGLRHASRRAASKIKEATIQAARPPRPAWEVKARRAMQATRSHESC